MSMQIIVLQLDPANLNSLFRIPRYFELKTISLGFAVQLFTIGYFEQSFVSPASSKWRSSTLFLMLSPIPVAIVEYCHSVKQAFLGLIQNLREERTPFYSAPSCLKIDAVALKNVILRANHLLRWLPIVYDRGRKLE